jgi:hypothetical protein
MKAIPPLILVGLLVGPTITHAQHTRHARQSKVRAAYKATGRLTTIHDPKFGLAEFNAAAFTMNPRVLNPRPAQSTAWIIHAKRDGTALALAAKHASPAAGDKLELAKGKTATVERVLTSSRHLDYTLLQVKLPQKAGIRPFKLTIEMPAANRVYAIGHPSINPGKGPLGKTIARGRQSTPAGRIEEVASWDADSSASVRLQAQATQRFWTFFGGPLFGPALGRAAGKAWGDQVAQSKRRELTSSPVTRFRMQTVGGFSGGPIVDRKTGRAVALLSSSDGKYGSTFGIPTALIVTDILRKSDTISAAAKPLVVDWVTSSFATSADGKRLVDR